MSVSSKFSLQKILEKCSAQKNWFDIQNMCLTFRYLLGGKNVPNVWNDNFDY